MIYCKQCLQPNTRPNEKFVEDRCSICNYYNSVSDTDWEARFDQLCEYLKKRKKQTTKNSFQKFDCFV